MVKGIVAATVAGHNLIEKGDHIVLGLSGGPDSVCLFDVLMDMADEMELTIHPVHLNHMFRPGDADRDQKYVEDLCRSRGLECVCRVVDCNALAEELGMTSEEAGRKARYDLFYETAMEIAGTIEGDGADRVKIAVAQNAWDQAETVLFRLLRGTGTDGLAGIAYKRQERGITVIRPLLDVHRNDIEKYCRDRGLNPVTDHTNNEPIYARNKIRLELLPLLEREYNSNMKECLVRLAGIAAADKDYFWQETDRAFRELRRLKDGAGREFDRGTVVLDREGLATIHVALRHRVMFRAFGEVGLDSDITAERLEAADRIVMKKQGPKTVEFPRGHKVTVAAGRVIFE